MVVIQTTFGLTHLRRNGFEEESIETKGGERLNQGKITCYHGMSNTIE